MHNWHQQNSHHYMTNERLGFPSRLFRLRFTANILYAFPNYPVRATFPFHFIPLI